MTDRITKLENIILNASGLFDVFAKDHECYEADLIAEAKRIKAKRIGNNEQ